MFESKIIDKSDKNAVMDLIESQGAYIDEFSLIEMDIPNLRGWFRDNNLYDKAQEEEMKKGLDFYEKTRSNLKIEIFERLINSTKKLILKSDYLPNCYAKLSFDIIYGLVFEREVNYVNLNENVNCVSLGGGDISDFSRVLVINSANDMICFVLNDAAINIINEHVNQNITEIFSNIDIDEY